MDEFEVKYEKRIVAFLDILGFKELITNSTKSTEILRSVFNSLSQLRDISAHLGNSEESIKYDRQEAVFSDNIAISYLSGSGEAEYNLCFDVVFLQLSLLYQGIMLRGGIAEGYLYHKSNLIFGPALVNAYQLESKCAVFPRVLVDDAIPASSSGTIFSIDFDNLTYLDFLRNYDLCSYMFENLNRVERFDVFSKIQENVQNMVSKDMGVNSKIGWLRNYCKDTFMLKNNQVEIIRNSFSKFDRITANNKYLGKQ